MDQFIPEDNKGSNEAHHKQGGKCWNPEHSWRCPLHKTGNLRHTI
jgi:hypothetical protein